jgi:hypothetical protein
MVDMDEHDLVHDPYRRCEEHCNHDLARGIGVTDLLSGDGPHPAAHLIINFALQRAVVFGDATEGLRAAG